MTATDAASLIPSGATVGMSGFYRSGLSQTAAAGAGRTHQRPSRPRPEVPAQCLDRRVHGAGARWRARQGRRHRSAAALSIRPDLPQAHQ
ncbi:MAG: hypothetical protein MZV49_11830 [Rhodopseudomonas palustris]|nr:hypothetical protein [Rhodopseudomonas palustris]